MTTRGFTNGSIDEQIVTTGFYSFYQYIQDVESFNNSLDFLSNEYIWYLDIETYSESGTKEDNLNPWKNSIRVITIKAGDAIYIFDCISLASVINNLLKMMPEKYVVGHNIKFDLLNLVVHFGPNILPSKVFDTLIASKINWFATTSEKGKFDLKSCLKRYLNMDISKEEETSNWGSEELTKEQLSYAAKDVNYLPELTKILIKYLNPKKED